MGGDLPEAKHQKEPNKSQDIYNKCKRVKCIWIEVGISQPGWTISVCLEHSRPIYQID